LDHSQIAKEEFHKSDQYQFSLERIRFKFLFEICLLKEIQSEFNSQQNFPERYHRIVFYSFIAFRLHNTPENALVLLEAFSTKLVEDNTAKIDAYSVYNIATYLLSVHTLSIASQFLSSIGSFFFNIIRVKNRDLAVPKQERTALIRISRLPGAVRIYSVAETIGNRKIR
jgi:hypothetical protein